MGLFSRCWCSIIGSCKHMKSDFLFNKEIATMLVSCYLSSKMKLWHFIRSIENVSVVHQFTLGLAHQLQQMQNCMKCFHLMLAEEINISVLKALTYKCECTERQNGSCRIPFCRGQGADTNILLPQKIFLLPPICPF